LGRGKSIRSEKADDIAVQVSFEQGMQQSLDDGAVRNLNSIMEEYLKN